MLQKDLEEPVIRVPGMAIIPDTLPSTSTTEPLTILRLNRSALIVFTLCTLAFVLGILLTVAPLSRLPDSDVSVHLALGSLLAGFGSWLPQNLGLTNLPVDARGSTALVEFFLLLGLVACCYGLGAWLVSRQQAAREQHLLRRFVWAGALLAGILYVFTPAMLSHDILVYTSYGRVLAVYHANPYFVPISHFPHDPFTRVNFWSKVVSIYGPLWICVCGLFGLFGLSTLTAALLVFRFFALAVHLLNIWLVGRILQQMGRASHTVTLGMLLYAWNPLVLLESSLGGHNDVFMLTFVLLSVLLAARAERRGQLFFSRGYLPPVIALTLAVLVKFTALPILAVYLLFLVCKAARPTQESARGLQQIWRHWRPVLLLPGQSLLTATLVALALYGPFWFGHPLPDILLGFKRAPSAVLEANSLMYSVVVWLHHKRATDLPFTLLTYRPFWDMLSYLGMAVCLGLGAGKLWSRPTTRTFVLAALAVLSPVLLTTPWFFAWYITWIIGLAVVSLPVRQSRLQTACLAFALTFSFSSLLTYLFMNNYQPFHAWAYLVGALTTFPPTCAFFFTLLFWQPEHHSVTGAIERW